MDLECQRFGALHWQAEKRRGGLFAIERICRPRSSAATSVGITAPSHLRRFKAETDFHEDDDARPNRRNHSAVQIHGHAYSLVGPKEPRDNAPIYFYSLQDAAKQRHHDNANLDRALLELLERMIRDCHPCARQCRSATEAMAEIRLLSQSLIQFNPCLQLKGQTRDQNTHNLPTAGTC